MSLNDRWENLPRDGKNFYKTREASVISKDGSGKERQTTEEVECITMTSMIFCRHGGLITPVFSGQVRAESDAVPQFPRVMRVSDKLIKLLKDYETGKDENDELKSTGEPAFTPYHSDSDKPNIKTIGWGHAMNNEEEGWYPSKEEKSINLYTMKDVNGDKVVEISLELAEELLAKDIREVEDAVNVKLEEGGIEYKVNQRFYDALCDLLFQSGVNQIQVNEKGEVTDLYNFLTEEQFDLGDTTTIKWQFGEYMGHGSDEVKKRRADELDIIFYGEYERNENDYKRHGNDIWGVYTAMKEGNH